jgi:hypothetical protein
MLLIAVTGWMFTRGLEGVMDILFWDEANYLNSGKMMFDKFNRQWGPGYALWYKLLSLFEQDSLKLYFLNYRLMTLLPAVALFVLLALSNVRFWVAFGVAFVFLYADINLPVWPKVSHYCVLVFLVALSVMRFLPATVLKLAFMLPATLFIAYARPEFYLSFIGIFVLFVISLFVDPASKKAGNLLPSFGFMFFAFAVQAFMGNPLFNFQGDRSGLAFAQHFMLNYFQWNDIDQDFWITWMPYFEKEFGNAPSLKAAFQANPDLFKRHLFSNIQEYIMSSYRLFTDVMLPEKMIALPLRARMAVLVLGGAISITWLGRELFTRTVLQNMSRNMLMVILLILFAIPSILSCIVIYPRLHYLILQVPLVILAACLIFFSQPVERPAKDWHNILLSLSILIAGWILMPSLSKYDYFDLWRKENSQANLKTVEKLRAYNFRLPIRLLENEGGMHLFLTDNYTWIRGFMKQEPWIDYIRNQRVDIIYVTPSLIKYPSLAADSTWPTFRDHPEQFGYQRISTGQHEPYLLISKSLLETVAE